ncbi:Abi family protein [Bifidobacterium catulorum]|uniref:Abi family protein n=1 Tax=Bifidobacterium catulorum TaxID=1630173 RepID=UPI001304F9AD|nr:Abi family protein [Bifidobacterium catulorum]
MPNEYGNALNEQIQNLKADGVQFQIFNETQAKEYLDHRINLFKIKRFRINFRWEEGEYQGVDFAHLADLASVDYQLRLFCGYIAGRVEHDLKLRFNHLLMLDAQHDGYAVANLIDPRQEYVFEGEADFRDRSKKFSHSPYTEDYIRSYLSEPEIWNLWEIFDLSALFNAYKDYLATLQKKDHLTKLFGSVRRLRNAAAHNTCLLIGVPRRNAPRTEYIDSCLKALFNNSIPTPTGSVIKKSQLAYDFASLLCAFLIATQSEEARKHAADAALQLSSRIRRNIRLYIPGTDCRELTALLATLINLCDGFAEYSMNNHKQSGPLFYVPWK